MRRSTKRIYLKTQIKQRTMSLNLLDLLKTQIGSSIADQASSFLGENKESVNTAMSGILPTLMGSLIKKGSNESGAAGIMDMITQGGFNDNMLSNMTNMFSGSDQSANLMNSGGNIINSLMGNQSSGIVDMIAKFAGIKQGSSSSLMKMAAPLLMSFLGKHIASKGLGVSGLMNLLKSQGQHVQSAMPAGLSGIGNQLGFSSFLNNVQDSGRRVVNETRETATAAATQGRSALSRLLPFLLLIGAALAIYYFMTGNSGQDAIDKIGDATENVVEGAEKAVNNVADATKDAANNVVDATKNAVDATTAAARNALNSITFAAGSAGERLANLLSSDAEITENIRFKNLTFETGSAAIVGETKVEVDNLAAVLKAYPDVNIEVQGYTDNTGNAEANVKLSQMRAEAVVASLTELGIAKERLTAKGYGAADPVATNDTDEGREQNRRIEVKVVR